MSPVSFDDLGVPFDSPYHSFDGAPLETGARAGIDCWVTEPDGTYIAHLDRSEASPFRAFAFSVERSAPGVGSLEYATPNALLAEVPTLLDAGNLVWMRYRGKTVTWVIEQETRRLSGEELPWTAVSGRGALQLLGDRLVWPDGFSEDDLDPSVWSGPGVFSTTLAQDADTGDGRIVVEDGDQLREGQRVTITDGANSDVTHIRRMILRDDGDWTLVLKDPLEHDYSAGDDVVRSGPAFLSTTLSASVVAGKRRIHVESAKRLHPGHRLLIQQDSPGTDGEYVVVREVEHVKAKSADATTLAVSASSGARAVTISGKHFSVGQTVTIDDGVHTDTHDIEDITKVSTSPLRYRLRLDGTLGHSYAAGTDIERGSVAEDWIVTLRRPLVYGYSTGDEVTRPSDQWHTVVGVAAGEMLWDLIEDTNDRFVTQIAQGTIETDDEDGDQWVQRFRFDSLLDVVGAVTDTHGDVTMDGLTFSYWNDLGDDLSGTVIFEEGADVLRVERDRDHRDAVSFVVAEGVGEGVRAKLAVSQDSTATRRREAYLDAHDATNLPMLEAIADAALEQNGARDAIALDLAETRYAAFIDYGLGDWVRVIVPSRGIDETVRIVALYVKETEERVQVEVDFNTQRTEELLEMDRAQRSSARTLGVHGRQPQGQLVPFTFSGSGVFDEDEAMEVFLHLPDRAFLIAEVTAKLQLRRFWATSRSAASGGGSTSGSGGGASGGGSTSGSGGGATLTDDADHDHAMFQWMSNTPGGYATRKYLDGSGVFLDLATDGPDNTRTSNSQATHSHNLSSHTHTTPDHSHGTHTHTTPDHTHDLVYGTYAETLPSGWAVKVYVDQLDGSTWTNVWDSAAIEDPDKFADLDLTQVITEPGSWRIRVKSNAGQANDGRLSADLWGVCLAGLESA